MRNTKSSIKTRILLQIFAVFLHFDLLRYLNYTNNYSGLKEPYCLFHHRTSSVAVMVLRVPQILQDTIALSSLMLTLLVQLTSTTISVDVSLEQPEQPLQKQFAVRKNFCLWLTMENCSKWISYLFSQPNSVQRPIPHRFFHKHWPSTNNWIQAHLLSNNLLKSTTG